MTLKYEQRAENAEHSIDLIKQKLGQTGDLRPQCILVARNSFKLLVISHSPDFVQQPTKPTMFGCGASDFMKSSSAIKLFFSFSSAAAV